jgi:hypothetical protein
MLSDGDPTRGIDDVNVIVSFCFYFIFVLFCFVFLFLFLFELRSLSYVKENIAKRQRPVIIHTTAVLMGDSHDSEEPKVFFFVC